MPREIAVGGSTSKKKLNFKDQQVTSDGSLNHHLIIAEKEKEYFLEE